MRCGKACHISAPGKIANFAFRYVEMHRSARGRRHAFPSRASSVIMLSYFEGFSAWTHPKLLAILRRFRQ